MKTLELALLSLNPMLVSIIQLFCYAYDESHDHDNNADMAKYKDLDPPSLVLFLQYLPLMPDGLNSYLLETLHHYLTRLSYLQVWPIFPYIFRKIHSMLVASISPALSCSPRILYFRWP